MADRSFRPEVGRVLEVLAEGLAPFVDQRMSAALDGSDWILTAAERMRKRADVVVAASDPQFQLDVLHRFWGQAFAEVLAERYRPVIDELRTARNHWAHFDDQHPIDLEYARRIHDLAEDLLRGVGAPEIDEVAELASDLELGAVRGDAERDGATEQLLAELRALRASRSELEAQLEAARGQVAVVGRRSRAVARQLAELQTQYAAVSGLRKRYDELRDVLGERLRGGEDVADEVADVVTAVGSLQSDADRLHEELERTRAMMHDLDPAQTPAGRRLLYLVTSMIVILLVVIVILIGAIRELG